MRVCSNYMMEEEVVYERWGGGGFGWGLQLIKGGLPCGGKDYGQS